MGPPLQGRECWVHPAGEGVVGPPCRGGSGGSALQGRESWVHLYREGGMGLPCRGGSVGSALQGRERWVHPAGEGEVGPPCRGGRGGSAPGKHCSCRLRSSQVAALCTRRHFPQPSSLSCTSPGAAESTAGKMCGCVCVCVCVCACGVRCAVCVVCVVCVGVSVRVGVRGVRQLFVCACKQVLSVKWPLRLGAKCFKGSQQAA